MNYVAPLGLIRFLSKNPGLRPGQAYIAPLGLNGQFETCLIYSQYLKKICIGSVQLCEYSEVLCATTVIRKILPIIENIPPMVEIN